MHSFDVMFKLKSALTINMGSQYSTGVLHEDIEKSFTFDTNTFDILESQYLKYSFIQGKYDMNAFFVDRKQFQQLFNLPKLASLSIFSLLDPTRKRKIVTTDVFGGLFLASSSAHVKDKVESLFRLADIHNTGTINKAELIMIMHSSCRGLARMKAIDPPPMCKIEEIVASYFEQISDVNQNKITLQDVSDFCKFDCKIRNYMSNLDSASLANVCSLYEKQSKLLRELLVIDNRLDKLEGIIP